MLVESHWIAFFVILLAWVGHAYLWTAVLNDTYARPYSKKLLKPWRHVTGLVILSFPLIAHVFQIPPRDLEDSSLKAFLFYWGGYYCLLCFCIGVFRFPYATIRRLLQKPTAILRHEATQTLDLRKELGPEVIGDGKGRLAAKLPFNDVFKVDFTELTLALPNLPPPLEGLTILHLTDLHFHGTPSRSWHDRVMQEIQSRWPQPDLVCLTGDYVDTDEHHAWIGPMLGRFEGREGNFAILGNHDQLHDPERVREHLADAGYTVLGNGCRIASVRGVPCLFVGHEGPWFRPPPDLRSPPESAFRICLSHSPDQFYWGLRNSFNLMLCGHVHGGQIRVPVIGSIFVPSVYGRRFDMGVFESGGMSMVVGRGLSGKEPLRIRCNPQVILVRLVTA